MAARASTLTIADGVRVVVPDALNLITPYVLFEQQDWFEDEIKFVRRLLQPSERVIDIGANYGTYTLSMAHAVGPQGTIFAFEPAASTADYLARSIAENGFSNIVLERSALSNAVGSARLATSEHAELNALEHGGPSQSTGETVRLVTLDEAMKRYAWTEIDFLKIDAEGEETRIIEGGRQFFATCSPLVMYEIKVGDSHNLDLALRFAALGYDSYRLVPGLGALAPFDASRKIDPFLLNLFCCKRDRAATLATRGLLFDHPEPADVPTDTAWEALMSLPYGKRLASHWLSSPAGPRRTEVHRALGYYLLSGDGSRNPAVRFAALESALTALCNLCTDETTYLRRASLARVAAELGERTLACEQLVRLDTSPLKPTDITEPFLAITRRFDAIAAGNDISQWLRASIAEGLETLFAFSSFFNGANALLRLEQIEALGYASEEMRRRLQLVRLRFPK